MRRKEPQQRSGRHRGDRPPPIEPPRLRDELRDNVKTVLFMPFAVIGLVAWGVETVSDTRSSQAHQWTGFAAICGGLLSGLSYILYFRPGVMAEESWHRDPLRRRVAFVARHLWTALLAGGFVVWLVAKIRS